MGLYKKLKDRLTKRETHSKPSAQLFDLYKNKIKEMRYCKISMEDQKQWCTFNDDQPEIIDTKIDKFKMEADGKYALELLLNFIDEIKTGDSSENLLDYIQISEKRNGKKTIKIVTELQKEKDKHLEPQILHTYTLKFCGK